MGVYLASRHITLGILIMTPRTGPGYMSMLEKMMRNPETRSLLYPYLPEPMRNPETFEWMLNNPEYRAQLEQVLSQQQVSSPSLRSRRDRDEYKRAHFWDGDVSQSVFGCTAVADCCWSTAPIVQMLRVALAPASSAHAHGRPACPDPDSLRAARRPDEPGDARPGGAIRHGQPRHEGAAGAAGHLPGPGTIAQMLSLNPMLAAKC